MRKMSVKQQLTAIERQSGKVSWGGKCVYVDMCMCVGSLDNQLNTLSLFELEP